MIKADQRALANSLVNKGLTPDQVIESLIEVEHQRYEEKLDALRRFRFELNHEYSRRPRGPAT